MDNTIEKFSNVCMCKPYAPATMTYSDKYGVNFEISKQFDQSCIALKHAEMTLMRYKNITLQNFDETMNFTVHTRLHNRYRDLLRL